MAGTIEGTDIIKDAKPDAEILAGAEAERFDFDFNFLANKPSEEVATENNPENEQVEVEEAKPEEAVEEKVEIESEKKPDKEPEEIAVDYKAQIIELEGKHKAAEEKLKSLESIQVALEEIKKEPLVFVRKHFPQLAQNLDPNKYIMDKLRTEFGAEFTYEPSESYQEGTPSYKYRLREMELRDNLVKENARIESTEFESKRKLESALADSKQKVMKDFKLSEEQFQKEVVDWGIKTPITYNEVAKLRFMDVIIKNAVEAALKESKGRKSVVDKPNKGAASIHSESEESERPEHLKELADTFGDI